jgi:AcrR family transcriptional regulator
MARRAADPPAGRARRKDAQRNCAAIVRAAREVFRSRGVDAPLEQVARAAEVGIGTLYRHFPTRTDLLDAVAAEAMAEHLAIAETALAIEDPWEGFCHYLVATCELEASDRTINDLLSIRLPKAKAAEALTRRVLEAAGTLLSRAQQAGRLRADVTTEDLVFVRWANTRILAATGSVAPEVWRRHLALLLDGLRAEAAHPLPEPPLTPRQTYRAMITLGRQLDRTLAKG